MGQITHSLGQIGAHLGYIFLRSKSETYHWETQRPRRHLSKSKIHFVRLFLEFHLYLRAFTHLIFIGALDLSSYHSLVSRHIRNYKLLIESE